MTSCCLICKRSLKRRKLLSDLVELDSTLRDLFEAPDCSGVFLCVVDSVVPEGESVVVCEVVGEWGDGDVSFEEFVDIGALVC